MSKQDPTANWNTCQLSSGLHPYSQHRCVSPSPSTARQTCHLFFGHQSMFTALCRAPIMHLLVTVSTLTMCKQNCTANTSTCQLSSGIHPCSQHFDASEGPYMCKQTCHLGVCEQSMFTALGRAPTMHLLFSPLPSPLTTPPLVPHFAASMFYRCCT